MLVGVCVCVRVRAGVLVYACVRACVSPSVRVCVRACMFVRVYVCVCGFQTAGSPLGFRTVRGGAR